MQQRKPQNFARRFHALLLAGLLNLGLSDKTLSTEEARTVSTAGFSQEEFVKVAMQRVQSEKLL
jgi:hypothetical protein